MQGVVQVAAPLRVHAQAAGRARRDHARVVQVALGDQVQRAPGPGRCRRDRVGELRQEVRRRGVGDLVDGVEPQRVDVEVLQPAQGAPDQEGAHAVAAGAVHVDRGAPRRAVALGEDRPEAGQHVALRAQVVEHAVEAHRQAGRVGGVDEPAQPRRAAVGVLGGVGEDTVVAPVAPTRELGHRHELDRGHAQLAQLREARNDAVERPLRRERADVQLVEDQLVERDAAPAAVAPVVPRRDHLGRPGDALGLERRCRVGQLVAAVQSVAVAAAGACPLGEAREDPVAAGRERDLVVRIEQHDVDPVGVRRPDGEPRFTPVGARRRPQAGAGLRHGASSGASRRHESGGRTSVIEWSRPWAGSATASIRPRLPAPLPP